jgi:hypothetical protein
MVIRPGFPSRDDEMGKIVMTLLSSTTAPIIAFDNVRGTVRSAVLEGLVTSPNVADRTLGKNTEALSLLNDRVWMMTGNNALLGGDLARRTLRITIDPKMPHPEARTGFRCNPVAWTRQHRSDYIAALLTVVRAWVNAGRPLAAVDRSDDYATWVATIRGILSVGGFPGLFADRSSRVEQSADDEAWERFLTAAVEVLGAGTPFSARDLAERIEQPGAFRAGGGPMIDPVLLPGDLAERFGRFGDETRFMKSLGLWLRNRVGRYAGDLTVAGLGYGTTGARKNVSIFAIERVTTGSELGRSRSES